MSKANFAFARSIPSFVTVVTARTIRAGSVVSAFPRWNPGHGCIGFISPRRSLLGLGRLARQIFVAGFVIVEENGRIGFEHALSIA